ncbi:bifunctional diguanylate cyclase/phosphodiesterase [Colwellia piezophila]|uniref:bifunctional diguanylate cyclase/phosphodiesterase n=1 Tax=Colwellia piezophila TaxID=211668 RepID=UPI00036F3A79|nr:EAL domain-containing protein [Colwellia piezophila]
MSVAIKTGISLRTLLYSLVIGIALVNFLGASWVSVEATRSYLNDQMKSHAQDAATSVGLSISPYMDEENLMIAETMIVAIFDSGYYQKVTLTDVDDKIIMSRENNKVIDGVPSWFIKIFELTPPIMSSEVNNGWNLGGTLSFQSHVGLSYIKLWQRAINNFLSSLLIALISCFAAHYILRSVLNPLAQVEAQAIAVSRKSFTFISKIPKTRELKTVINAMNTMVSNIQASFDLVSTQANKLTNELYIDDLTQLGNRRAFQGQFKAANNEIQPDDFTTLGLVQLHSLQSINTELGYKAGDDYVRQAAQLLTEQLNSFSGAKVYRVNGGSFFFTINSVGEDVIKFCQHINNEFSVLNSQYYEEGFGKLVAITYNSSEALSDLLAKLDTLLTQENSATSLGQVYNDKSNITAQTAHGLHQWSNIIDELVQSKHIEFTFQPVISRTDDSTDSDSTESEDVLYYELFSQFLNNDEVVANNQLYAMAERTKKSQELDKLVLNKLATLTTLSLECKVAINLTHQSLHSSEFRHWLVSFIKQHKTKLPRLVFEINEEAILAGIDSSIDFIQSVKSLGIEVCIDRFGSSFTSFKYLKGLDVDYLKIDGAYIHELELNLENKHFIQAVTLIGHGLGVKILTSHVDSSATKLLLLEAHCDGLQGNYIQKTLPLQRKDTERGCIYSPIKLS